MGRSSLNQEIATPGDDNNGDLGFSWSHERSLFKRTHPHQGNNADRTKLADRHSRGSRPSHYSRRKVIQLRGRSLIYFVILLAVFGFAVASMVLQSSITSLFRQGSETGRRRLFKEGLEFGGSFEFVPLRRFDENGRLDRLRLEARVVVRSPRLALILGNMKKNPESLMLFTVMKNLQQLGYMLKLYSVEDGEARTMWKQIGGPVSILNHERYGHLDWSLFEGVIADSVEAKEVISSLMQEPFCSVPLIWIIHEDTLAKRLPFYKKMGWEHLISHWGSAFSRADVVVFPDFSLPMLYSVLDNGNFFVIPGSPVDVWSVESYVKTHSKYDMRQRNGYGRDDLLVLVVGSSFFFNQLSWDYAVALHTLGPLLIKYAKRKYDGGSFTFVFLCGNSTDGFIDPMQEVAAHLRLSPGSIRHYCMNGDVNGVLLMADIVLYGSFQDEQGFPSILTRAMSFGIPIIAPDLPLIKKYVVDGVHGMFFSKHNPDDLLRAFSLLISRDGRLSKFASVVGSSGKVLAKNLLASECINGYAKLMENLLNFPSDVSLPNPISQIHQHSWDWNSIRAVMGQRADDTISTDNDDAVTQTTSVIYSLEDTMSSIMDSRNISQYNAGDLEQDLFNVEDWDVLKEIESFEELERREIEQIEDRMGKNPGHWDEIYRNARKSEKLRFEANERDEGELERTGQPVCIYEVYCGAGAWPFLHHGSLYRGLSLSTRSTRLSSDDIDAASRLPLLNDSYYRDLLCEIGGMFSIAYKVDVIHKRPWIGFQSWRASGRMVSLSNKAEFVLEKKIQRQTKGDVMYFWTRLGMDGGLTGSYDSLTFWSMCDVLNGGQCRTAFENAFRHMYGLPPSLEALPPMPEDGGRWSSLHSWVMPTPSFLEFIMFSRMFVDSLNSLHGNTCKTTCLLGSSQLERKHCYCRILELLVNVWAYHSARRMVYIDPQTGLLEEHHPIARRKGFMWVKYFNSTLLKSMDEDLAEAADDGDIPSDTWLWPLTGEVHWQGIYEREREERYREKMDKKRKIKVKLLERMKFGYKQKTLGG
ncbi:hypothetical protein Nepgr_013080 [Nepenthes gracilis]|uniref:Glycosyl transferase family 1 domain-containing protein n=1 Tax=Nepenthes gracilis TaxID=150966 RepID=A0AAD3SII6_NEPGR|nr:hypothetical protein Nepgr_013080 [Nepenthes gracilis]